MSVGEEVGRVYAIDEDSGDNGRIRFRFFEFLDDSKNLSDIQWMGTGISRSMNNRE